MAFFSCLVDSLESLLLLEGQLLAVDLDSTEVWHAVGFELRAFAIGSKTTVGVVESRLFLLHVDQISLPEFKRLFTLSCDLN